MSNRTKNIIYPIILLSVMFVVWKMRQPDTPTQQVAFSGQTMGTTYNVAYYDTKNTNYKAGIDSLLQVFNQSLNHYLPDSELSRFNRDTNWQFELPYFSKILSGSEKFFKLTNGAFDPTVMPLVNAWGFGPGEKAIPDSTTIDSLKALVGFDKIVVDSRRVSKTDARATLDFSAIAKGYGVDVVVAYLREKGINNLFVEIGGEVRCLGQNLTDKRPWRVGIIDPDSDLLNKKVKTTVLLENKAMATSANNFNYRVVDGVKFSHTISPYTGYPIKQAILSASVFADNCMAADALATAFMVMGHQKAIALLNDHPEIDAYLVFSTPDGNTSTYATSGISEKIAD